MKRALCIGIALFAVVFASLAASAQVKKGKTRLLLTKQLMYFTESALA